MAVNGLFGLRVTSFTGMSWQRELAKRVTSIVIIAASRRFPPLPATKQQPQVTTEKRRGWNIEGLNGKKENCEGHSRRVLY
jgi:hypothetical protein